MAHALIGESEAVIEPTLRSTDLPSDEELLRLISVEQDPPAFEAFFDRHVHHAFNFACRLLSSRQQAEDVVQEVFLDIWRGSGRPCRGKARSWFLGVVARKCLQTKRRRSEPTLDRKDLEALSPAVFVAAQQAIERKELLANLRSLLAELSNPDYRLLELYFSAGCTQVKIARTMNLPQRTISGRLLRLQEELRNRLK